ncbi:hypothetical protein [Granulicoccus sp. GXG6511]|uniref:hypothetical protein n=1 Tax=Granulicoccus sp. GXG6511 TaxID=3381351 RepID=UPI003D7ED7FE
MDALTLMITVAVLTVAIAMMVALVVKVITLVMGRAGRRAPEEIVDAIVPTAAVPAGGSAPPEEHVAVIAAAVSVVFDDDARIVHIQPRAETAWAASGRQTHHTSHHLGPRTAPRHTAPRPRDPGGPA